MDKKLQSEDMNFRAMGTDVSAEIIIQNFEEKKKAKRALLNLRKIFEKNEKIFSRFRDDSELSRLNENLGKEVEISPEMLEVLKMCLKFNEISEGYFDPRIIGNLEKIGYNRDFRSHNLNQLQGKDIVLERISGDLKNDLKLNAGAHKALIRRRIDTTGIAKGYTVDKAVEYLKKEGFTDFIMDAGGDIFAQGLNQDREDWKIAVEGLENGKLMLMLHNQGVATSGISRKKWTVGENKFHHLVNPHNPQDFSWNLKTVTVIKESTVEADGRAKVLFLMGQEKGLEFANVNNLKALFLDYKGNVSLSEAMKEKVI